MIRATLTQVLKLSQASINKRTSGNIVNVMSSDCEKLIYLWRLLAYIIVGPLSLATVAWFSFIEMGYSALVGLGVVLILFPFKGCKTLKVHVYPCMKDFIFIRKNRVWETDRVA